MFLLSCFICVYLEIFFLNDGIIKFILLTKKFTQMRVFKTFVSKLIYALRFLIRDGNECSVESLIGDIDLTKSASSNRRSRIIYENLHKQMFIRRNGPHPLLSEHYRKRTLNKLFPSGWNFIKANLNLPSKAYTTRLNKTKADTTFCFS